MPWDEAAPPDPGRIAEGWVRRFIADRTRADEAMHLYRQLGFEVAADPIAPGKLPGVCQECMPPGQREFCTVYTRKRSEKPAGSGESRATPTDGGRAG